MFVAIFQCIIIGALSVLQVQTAGVQVGIHAQVFIGDKGREDRCLGGKTTGVVQPQSAVTTGAQNSESLSERLIQDTSLQD